MPAIASREGHNVRVIPLRRARTGVLAALLVPALLLAGCGDDGDGGSTPDAEPSVDLPTGSVEVPEGTELTKAGTTLDFGEPAVVAYEPNTKRSTVLRLAVQSVQQRPISDLAAYDLEPATRKSRLYYVRFSARNVGTGDVSRTAVPLLAVDDRNTMIQPSTFNNTFSRCPSRPFPAGFKPGEAFFGCLAYLVPNRGTLEHMSFRPLQAFEPIIWEGAIKPPPEARKKAQKKAEKKAQKKNND
jgi:hypothetical protein